MDSDIPDWVTEPDPSTTRAISRREWQAIVARHQGNVGASTKDQHRAFTEREIERSDKARFARFRTRTKRK